MGVAGTGCRFGEIASLKWTDFDNYAKTFHIKDPKNKISRFVHVDGALYELIKKKREYSDNEFVFPNKLGNQMREVNNTWGRVANRLFNKNINDPRDKVVFHTLRHTLASWLAIDGIPLYTIMTLMGHQSLKMTMIYARLSTDVCKEAAKQVLSKVDTLNIQTFPST
ncbi:MAG: site-specific integrase [Deltaproteobacteria bacterium]|nr:site-specific integrase [Deltaproteobacteria bacterium]